MKIIKRNGSSQNFNPNKIYNRIKDQAKGLSGINVDEVFKKVMPTIQDGLTTTQIDENIAFTLADMVIKHPNYSVLGGRILMTRQAKILNTNPEPVDLTYDFFSAYTFLQKYSLKNDKEQPIELPSMMYRRVANYLGIDETEKELFYEELSSKKINASTPIATNAGSVTRNSLISCNLSTNIGDDTNSILKTLSNISLASREGEGIGLLLDNVRSDESIVNSFKGKAGGVVRYADMVQSHMRFFKQGSRSGSAALYLSVWHKDILKFLELTLNTGDEQNRTRDLFTAVNLHDNFMKALIAGDDWYVFCPNDILKAGLTPFQDLWGVEFEAEYNKAVELGIGTKVSPKVIWDAMLKSQVDNGRPYVLHKDNANRKNMQKNIGTISQSNLCVTGETLILTDEGYVSIKEKEGEKVNVYNGEEFSEVTIFKTAESADIMEVQTDSGFSLKCTPEHEWYIQNTYLKSSIKKVKTKELKPGDNIIKFNPPVIEGSKDLKYAYTQGFYCGDGCNPNDDRDNTALIYLYGEKQRLLPYIESRNKIASSGLNRQEIPNTPAVMIEEKNNRTICKCPLDMNTDKFFVPDASYTIESRLLWLAGIFDSDGTLLKNVETKGKIAETIQLSSTSLEFLQKIQLMLQTLGCQSKIKNLRKAGRYLLPKNDGSGELGLYQCKEAYRLLINVHYLYNLTNIGFKCYRLQFEGTKPNRDASRFVKIKSVTPLEGKQSTYCFTEPKRNMGVFNGLLTGQCIEIIEVSKPNYTPQCALLSINLAEHDSLESIAKSTRIGTRMLNRVIDNNVWSDEASAAAGEDQRALAIGVAGMADFFAKKKISFESEEASIWNDLITRTMYTNAAQESYEMALVEGCYPAWEGSPYSEGTTYVDGFVPEGVKVGDPIPMRNSLLLGFMPTACVSKSTPIKTSKGVQTYQEVLEEKGIDYEYIESNGLIGWYIFNTPLEVFDKENNLQESLKVYYSGLRETLNIEFEDGFILNCTSNHKLLVNRNQDQIFVQAKDLKEGDDMLITTIKSITKGETIPVWDINVPQGEHYQLENGVISHNSSAILSGCFESFQPPDSNMFSRKVGQGEFLIVNKYLVKELEELGIWNDEMVNAIIRNNGSVQGIPMIPEDVQFRYKTVWEIPQKTLIDLAVIRNAYIDQSQSMNLYFADAKYGKISAALKYGWENGLKTGVYYTRTKSKLEASAKLAGAAEIPQKPKDSPFECFNCSA